MIGSEKHPINRNIRRNMIMALQETVDGIEINYSERRPRASAWCAKGSGRTTYAATRADVVAIHKKKLELNRECEEMIRHCNEVIFKLQNR